MDVTSVVTGSVGQEVWHAASVALALCVIVKNAGENTKGKMIRLLLSVALLLCGVYGCVGNGVACADDLNGWQPPAQQMQLTPQQRAYYRNPDGSCVQCSIGMCGVWCNDSNAASLLWDTEYGKAVRGGSTPQRVAAYCNQRKIIAYNVTGSDSTFEWMRWAAKTGRFAAIGAASRHFQTLYGYDPDLKLWGVCNNNNNAAMDKIDIYTDAQFRQLHLASGAWCVVLQRSSPANPIPVKWW